MAVPVIPGFAHPADIIERTGHDPNGTGKALSRGGVKMAFLVEEDDLGLEDIDDEAWDGDEALIEWFVEAGLLETPYVRPRRVYLPRRRLYVRRRRSPWRRRRRRPPVVYRRPAPPRAYY